ncbi:MipA/OmpV family protein [Fusobacterium russii]|uniref:MipA/OmpV family protein n=1 Tax=Fusobacterium russii TaxID=854 RepID=UPI00039AC1AE|nr:MipA/OmpV family protein [Fusobacterium russii]
MKKKYILTALLLVSSFAFSNSISVGGVVGKQSGLYRGSEDTLILPYVKVNYANFYIDGTQIGYKFLNTDVLDLSVYSNLQDGHSIKASNMDYGYRSINERKKQITGGLKLEAPLNIVGETINLRTSIEAGRRGAHGKLELSKLIKATDNFIIIPNINSRYFEKDYTRYYFGISDNELAEAIKEKYRPDNAYTLGAGIYSEYFFNRAFSMFAYASLDKYSKEVRRSPIIKNDIVTNVGVGLKFSF